MTLLEEERTKIMEQKQNSTEILEKDLGNFKAR